MTASPATRPQSNDRYEIERTLGETPCGPVLLATDRTRKQPVAIFTLPAARQDEDRAAYDRCLSRFQRGMEVSRLVRHPNLVETYAVTVAPDGAARSVVEYVDGPTVQQRLARGPLDTMHAVAVARDLSRALAALHAAGVVHRDVAPANILIAPDGAAKLTGYGEAQIGRGEVLYGLAADRPGTPGYRSPEQESGLGGVDGRADLYSLGAVLYEMLTGIPYAPQQRALNRPDLPSALVTLVGSLLERQPAFRPQNADSVARDLDTILQPSASSAPDPFAPITQASDLARPISLSPAPALPPPPTEQFTLPPSSVTFAPSSMPVPPAQPAPSSQPPPAPMPPAAPTPPPVISAPPRQQQLAPQPPPRPQPPRPQAPQQPVYAPPPYPVVPPAPSGPPPVQYGGPPQRAGRDRIFAPLPTDDPRTAPPPPRKGGRNVIGIIAAVIAGIFILRSIAAPSSRPSSFPTATRAPFATATRALPTATRAVSSATSRTGSASAISGTAPVGSRVSGTAAGTLATRAVPQEAATGGTLWQDPKGRVTFMLPQGWRVLSVGSQPDSVVTVYGDNAFMQIKTGGTSRSLDADLSLLKTAQGISNTTRYTYEPIATVTIGGEQGRSLRWEATPATATGGSGASSTGGEWLVDHNGTRFSFLVSDGNATGRANAEALIASVTFS